MQFTVIVGKEEVLVKIVIQSLLAVTYKGKEYFIQPENDGNKVTWKLKTGKLDTKVVTAIGRAIEKHAQK